MQGRPLRIVVVDEGFIGSLHTAIALSDLGCDVLLAGAVGGGAEYERGQFRSIACPLPHDPAFLSHIHALLSAFEPDVIYPTTEPTLLRLLDDAVCAPLVFPTIDARQRRCVMDKQVVLEIAAAAGVRVPATHIARRDRYPAVVKASSGRGGDAVFIVNDDAEAARASAAIRGAGREPLVQQYINGPTYLVGGVFDHGAALRLYAGRKIRQQPPRTGPASVIESADEPELIAAALEVFHALEWHGLASCDFVRDAAGDFYFLEVNLRPWGSIVAAADAAVDVFRPLLMLMNREPVQPDLRFNANVRTEIFPLYLLDWSFRLDPRTLLRIRRDLGRHELWRDVRFLRHAIFRLLQVRANWPSLTNHV